MICGSLQRRNSFHRGLPWEERDVFLPVQIKRMRRGQKPTGNLFLWMPVSIQLKRDLALGTSGAFFPILPPKFSFFINFPVTPAPVVFVLGQERVIADWKTQNWSAKCLLSVQRAVGRNFNYKPHLPNLIPVLLPGDQSPGFFPLLLRIQCVGRGNVYVC